MTKQPEPALVSPMTSKDYFPQYLYGSVVPEHWLNADWWDPAYMGYPNLKLSFESRSVTDWLLYRQIEALSSAIKVPFAHAAHWAVRKALGENFERARQMDMQQIPWDPELKYVCRRYALQLCKSEGPGDEHDIGLVDHMIYPLLLPDELLIYEMKPKNGLPC